jgi:hypothetical protein
MVVRVTGGEIPQDEIEQYKARACEKYGEACQQLDISVDGDWVDLHYSIVPFDRIRRITGKRPQ